MNVARSCSPRGLIAGLMGFLGLMSTAGMGCGRAASTAPPPHSAAEPVAADGGLPPPVPSQKKGLIMPSDTGLGQQPTTGGPTTGTNDRTVGPTLGNPGN